MEWITTSTRRYTPDRSGGETQGSAAGSGLAVERFVSAVDTDEFPSSLFTIPQTSYYAQYYFSHGFYRALGEGQLQWELVGVESGKRMAYQKGMIETFNAKFKESSGQAFLSAYERTCRASFMSTFDDYANHAKLDIDFTCVIGSDYDDILQPSSNPGKPYRFLSE